MGTTQNYGYNVPVGSDNVNLLPQMAANFPMIDSDLKAVSNTGVGTATELVTGTVHALTRADRDRNVFKFVATSNFEASETFEVDGTQVTAKTPDGRNLSTGAYVINSTVLCMLEGTLLTVLVNPAKALDSENLDGHPATYFATAAALSALDNQLGAVSSKVGTGVLDVGNDCVDGINTLNIHLTDYIKTEYIKLNSVTFSGQYGYATLTMTVPSGYKFLTVCNAGSSNMDILPFNTYRDGNTSNIIVYCRNFTNGSITTDIHVTALYIRD